MCGGPRTGTMVATRTPRWIPPGAGTRRTRVRNQQKRTKRRVCREQDGTGVCPNGGRVRRSRVCPEQPADSQLDRIPRPLQHTRRHTVWDAAAQALVLRPLGGTPVRARPAPAPAPGPASASATTLAPTPAPTRRTVTSPPPCLRAGSLPHLDRCPRAPWVSESKRERATDNGAELPDPEAQARLACGLPLSFV